LTTSSRHGPDDGRMGQLLAVGGIVTATLAFLGLIWALDRV
jgi:hypothetical protein